MNAPRPNNPRVRIAGFAVLAVCALAGSTTFAKELTAAPAIFSNAPKLTPPVFVAHEALTPPVEMPVVREPAVPVTRMPTITAADAGSDTDIVTRSDDHPVMQVPGGAQPRYPDILKKAGLGGAVLVAFVVNADGSVDTTTAKFIHVTHALFRDAIIAALPHMQFRPAVVNGQPVRQLVQAPYIFNVDGGPMSTAEGQRATLETLLSDTGSNGILTLSVVIITAMP